MGSGMATNSIKPISSYFRMISLFLRVLRKIASKIFLRIGTLKNSFVIKSKKRSMKKIGNILPTIAMGKTFQTGNLYFSIPMGIPPLNSKIGIMEMKKTFSSEETLNLSILSSNFAFNPDFAKAGINIKAINKMMIIFLKVSILLFQSKEQKYNLRNLIENTCLSLF